MCSHLEKNTYSDKIVQKTAVWAVMAAQKKKLILAQTTYPLISGVLGESKILVYLPMKTPRLKKLQRTSIIHT